MRVPAIRDARAPAHRVDDACAGHHARDGVKPYVQGDFRPLGSSRASRPRVRPHPAAARRFHGREVRLYVGSAGSVLVISITVTITCAGADD